VMSNSLRKGRAVIVNALAPASNTMPFTSVGAEVETLLIFDD
jgi:hypothetical protein